MNLLSIIATVVGVIIILDYFNKFRMTKSVLNRLRKKADDAAESVRDPVADAHVALKNIEDQKDKMQQLRVTLLVEVKTAKGKMEAHLAESAKYEELAKKAGAAGNAADVRLALEKKRAADAAFAAEESNFKRFQEQEDKVEARLKEFDALIAQAKARQKTLVSELQIQEFNQKVAETLKGGGDATSALEQLEKDVQRAKARAEAAGEIGDEARSLEDKYSAPTSVSDEDVNKYLQK